MRPSILEGDRIFVNKCAYALKVPFTLWRVAEWSAPQRGDVVIFFHPRTGQRLVKRIVALPGETIALRDNVLWIDGRPAAYAPAPGGDGQQRGLLEIIDGRSHPVLLTPRASAKRDFAPVAVPAGEYFLMGDNRDQSYDSRYFGTVPRRFIVGRSPAVVFSLDSDHHYRPRTDRFLRGIP